MTARLNDAAIIASINNVISREHAHVTAKQRDAIVTKVLATVSDDCRNEECYRGLATNESFLSGDIAMAIKGDFRLGAAVPTADEIYAQRVAVLEASGVTVDGQKRMKLLREAQLMSDEERLDALTTPVAKSAAVTPVAPAPASPAAQSKEQQRRAVIDHLDARIDRDFGQGARHKIGAAKRADLHRRYAAEVNGGDTSPRRWKRILAPAFTIPPSLRLTPAWPTCWRRWLRIFP